VDARALTRQARCTRWGGFLDGIDRFDPRFFDDATEAVSLDLQQRLLLEVSWRRRNAGSTPIAAGQLDRCLHRHQWQR
jgi:acyl transferase domain-containing protein